MGINKCILCNSNTTNNYIFCSKCTPKYGDIIKWYNIDIYVSGFKLHKLLVSLYNKQIPVGWFVGTDALTLVKNPIGKNIFKILLHRLRIRIMQLFIKEWWVVDTRLLKHLNKFGGFKYTKTVIWPPIIQTKLKKKKHNGFNILYYKPKENNEYQRWVYGIDLIENIKENINEVNFIEIDGTQEIKKILPIIDLYLRPSRHDGKPRLVEECIINEIPFYYSKDGNPTIKKIKDKITYEVAAANSNN